MYPAADNTSHPTRLIQGRMEPSSTGQPGGDATYSTSVMIQCCSSVWNNYLFVFPVVCERLPSLPFSPPPAAAFPPAFPGLRRGSCGGYGQRGPGGLIDLPTAEQRL